jgi:putative CRISPR-associated protein (TIGR02620 family)
MKDVIIVTRHPAMVEFLRDYCGITGKVIAHATAADVAGRRVVGTLPLHLAALAASVTEVTLNLPPELRGKELTVEQLDKYSQSLQTFVVRSEESFFSVIREQAFFEADGVWDRPSQDPLIRLRKEEEAAKEKEESKWGLEVEEE